MDKEFFLKETHQYIDDVYARFEEYQNTVYSILQETDRICRKNGIAYFLGYGTLLGAIRDHGPIPWDYDIDIEVPVTQRKKLIESLKSELGPDYYYAYLDNTDKYPTYCIRVGKKGYHFNALHVDIFFLIGAPASEAEQKPFLKKLNNYCDHRLAKYAQYWFGKKESKADRIIGAYSKLRNLFYSERRLSRMEKSLTTKYNYDESEYCCALGRVFWVFPKTCYGEGKDIVINGYTYRIPNDPDTILAKTYKDPMAYLPIRKRFEEFYAMTNTIEDRL